MLKITWGLEEEVFIIEEEWRPSLRSLYYLNKLLWKNPAFYYLHTASNFSRGKDIKFGLMSGVEISTDIQSSPECLISDLKARRQDLIKVVDEGYLVAIGHLLDIETPTNTCGLHLHIGVAEKFKEKVYNRLAYYLPLLALATSNSPMRGGVYFGKSFRMKSSYAIGPLVEDPYYRFQDIIISRRLKTIEIRVFDPFTQLDRLAALLSIIEKLIHIDNPKKTNPGTYALLRERMVRFGFHNSLIPLYDELISEVGYVDKSLFSKTPADETWQAYREGGLAGAYYYLDSIYRNERVKRRRKGESKKELLVLHSLLGFTSYYLPRLPYSIYKVLKES